MNALTYVPTLRGDAMLLTHGREGTERLVGAALLLDAVRGGQVDVVETRVVAGPERAEDALLAELRSRVQVGVPDTPRGWIDRAALFAPGRIAAELIRAGVAVPHERRFRRGVSVDPRAEAAARARVDDDPLLAAVLHASGLERPCLPPLTRSLPRAALQLVSALAASHI